MISLVEETDLLRVNSGVGHKGGSAVRVTKAVYEMEAVRQGQTSKVRETRRALEEVVSTSSPCITR